MLLILYFTICLALVTLVVGENGALPLHHTSSSKNSLFAPQAQPAREFPAAASAPDIHQQKRQSFANQVKLVAGDLEAGAQFGYTVAISSDGLTALIGAGGKNERFADAGAAYVFIRNGAGQWEQLTKLVAAGDLEASARFGDSVALSSDGLTALIGAAGKDEGEFSYAGTAYVFIRNGTGQWGQQTKLVATDDMEANALFGSSVSISSDGSVVLVGADGKDEGGLADVGAAYVFIRNGAGQWEPQTKLVAGDLEGGASFGDSVVISSDGSTALIGANLKNEGGFDFTGAAYVFIRNGAGQWVQQTKLVAGDMEREAYFGSSVAISSAGSVVLIGADGKDEGGLADAGVAYVFIRNSAGQWEQQTKLVAGDMESFAKFGSIVELSSDGSVALIGAIGKDEGGLADVGVAYVFIQNGAGQWEQQKKLVAGDLEGGASFGYSVALSSSTAFIGAFKKDEAGFSDAGASYLFKIFPPTLSPTPQPTSAPTSTPQPTTAPQDSDNNQPPVIIPCFEITDCAECTANRYSITSESTCQWGRVPRKEKLCHKPTADHIVSTEGPQANSPAECSVWSDRSWDCSLNDMIKCMPNVFDISCRDASDKCACFSEMISCLYEEGCGFDDTRGRCFGTLGELANSCPACNESFLSKVLYQRNTSIGVGVGVGALFICGALVIVFAVRRSRRGSGGDDKVPGKHELSTSVGGGRGRSRGSRPHSRSLAGSSGGRSHRASNSHLQRQYAEDSSGTWQSASSVPRTTSTMTRSSVGAYTSQQTGTFGGMPPAPAASTLSLPPPPPPMSTGTAGPQYIYQKFTPK